MKNTIITLCLTGLLGLELSGCAQPQLPAASNPAVIGGITKPIVFNWIQDYQVTKYSSKIKTLVAIAQQNPNKKVVIFYGSPACDKLSKDIQVAFESYNMPTTMIPNHDPKRPDLTYVYVNFSAIDSQDEYASISSESESVRYLKANGNY